MRRINSNDFYVSNAIFFKIKQNLKTFLLKNLKKSTMQPLFRNSAVLNSTLIQGQNLPQRHDVQVASFHVLCSKTSLKHNCNL
jgi:hypothetical protein